jgi:hypothetical protein
MIGVSRRWRPALLVAAIAASLTSAAGADDPPLRAMRWLPAGSDRVALLTLAPAECLASASNPATAIAIEIGRAAFRTPLLLGGQAARAGLSCDSCHRNGRGNPAFAFPGISGAPGTADVTAALFSRRRGDGIANPRPIPDLAADPRRIAPAALPAFVTGQIVEEFDGAVPPPAVLAGLVAYLGALDARACKGGPTATTTITARATLSDASRAVTAARAALAGGDGATAALLVLAARAQLGLLDERFPAAQQRPIRAADSALAAILPAIRAGDASADARLAAWQAATPALASRLAAARRRSLYDPARLAAAIAARSETASADPGVHGARR